jgi:hypothetical protein
VQDGSEQLSRINFDTYMRRVEAKPWMCMCVCVIDLDRPQIDP